MSNAHTTKQRPHLLEVIVPIATFFLGCLFTLGLQFYENRNKDMEESVKQVCKLTKDWYSQIQNSLHYNSLNNPAPVLDPAVYDYLHNRIILPDLLFHREILRKHHKCKQLISELDYFLQIVTQQGPPVSRMTPSGGVPTIPTNSSRAAPATTITLTASNSSAANSATRVEFYCSELDMLAQNFGGEDALLKELDACIQRIVICAGRLL